MSDFFKDKVVAITGGSQGIGKALIELLLPMGAKVATCGRNQDKLYDLQLRHSNQPLHCIVADVSNYNDCKLFIESTLKQFGSIDILINNAGVSMRSLLKDAEIDVFRKVMDKMCIRDRICKRLIKNHNEIIFKIFRNTAAVACAVAYDFIFCRNYPDVRTLIAVSYTHLDVYKRQV